MSQCESYSDSSTQLRLGSSAESSHAVPVLPGRIGQPNACSPTFDILNRARNTLMSKLPRTRRAVSAHLIVPARDERQSEGIQLIPKKPAALLNSADSVGIGSRDRLLGIVGTLVVGIILASTVYCIVRYLL